MKTHRVLIGIVLFLCLFLLLDRSLAAVCRALTLQSSLRFSRLYAGKCSAEILVLGNSRGVSLIYPPDAIAAMKTSIENLSYNGTGIEVTEALLKDYVEHNPPPKLVILEVSNLNVSNDVIKNLKLYEDESPRLQAILKQEVPDIYYGCELTKLFRYNTEVFLRALYFLKYRDQDQANRYKMTPAFVENYAPGQRQFGGVFDARKDHPECQCQILPNGENAFREILKCAKEHGFEVRLVLAPYLLKHIEAFDGSVEAWKKRLQEIAGPDMTIHDYTHFLTNSTDFADPVHINLDGTKSLLPKLIADGVFELPTAKTTP